MKWSRRWAYAAWLVLIGAFALFHAVQPARRFSQPLAVDLRLGQVYRRRMVWQRRRSRAPVRQLVSRGRFQPGRGGSGVAVPRVAAVFLHRSDDRGGARAGGCLLLCQSAVELPAAARARPALDGAARRDAAGDQPVPLLLQPAGHSGAAAHRVHAGRSESCRPPAAVAAAG